MAAAPTPDELSDVVAFIAAQQAHPDRRIAYVGTDVGGIRAELDGLEPSWVTTARVLRDDAGITGTVIAEWDVDLARAWILGPWVMGEGDMWMAAAVTLLDAALARLPAMVTRYEMCGDTANDRLAALAVTRGWARTEPHHVLLAEADVIAAWPTRGGGERMAPLRPAGPDDVAAIAALHDVEFPDSYASAAQLVDGQLEGSRVVLVVDAGSGGILGYAAGEVHDDGEGFIDFVAVDPAARGRRRPAARHGRHPPSPRSIAARPRGPNCPGPPTAGPQPVRPARLPPRRIARRLPLVDAHELNSTNSDAWVMPGSRRRRRPPRPVTRTKPTRTMTARATMTTAPLPEP